MKINIFPADYSLLNTLLPIISYVLCYNGRILYVDLLLEERYVLLTF